jgi:light-regulated signal transduction histidine kinase (bacteriophytochrome)
MNDLLLDVLSDLEIEIKRSNATVEMEQLPELKVIPTQMRQLFQNLISNSIKFSRPGIHPYIRIWSEKAETNSNSGTSGQNGFSHKLMIRDNGIGFEPKYAEDIFVVFKRLHSYHEIEGTGIGLSICKKIVEKHNGEIKAESSPGKGSTFIICLPAGN